MEMDGSFETIQDRTWLSVGVLMPRHPIHQNDLEKFITLMENGANLVFQKPDHRMGNAAALKNTTRLR